MLYNATVDRPVTPIRPAATSKPKRTKTEPLKVPCHKILFTPATQSVSSIGVTINQTPHQFTFAGHEINVSAASPVNLDLTDRKVLDFILILLTKYLSATGPWTDGWVSFTLGDVLHRFCIDRYHYRDEKSPRISRTYFDMIGRTLDKLALLRLRQDDGPEFGLVEPCRLAKRGGEAQKKDVIAGCGCFVVQVPQSLLDHLAERGMSSSGKLRIVPFLDSLFYLVSDNAYAIAKRMMSHYHFYSNAKSGNRDKFRVQTLIKCCPDLKSKLPADRRRTFIKALRSLASPAKTFGEPIIPCNYADERLPVAYEDWLNVMIQFEPHEVEYISRDDLDTAHDLLQYDDEQQPAQDVDFPDDEQQSESVASVA